MRRASRGTTIAAVGVAVALAAAGCTQKLLLFEGDEGTQLQLLALGSVLILAALLNVYTIREFGGAR